MSKIEEDALFLLVQSMTPSEKRFFKIDALKNIKNGQANFIQLFDYLGSIDDYSEAELVQKAFCKPSQLSNLKAHLYHKLLACLRQVPSLQTVDIVVRDEINNAVVLYNKGLYQQSLITLNKAKKKAIKYDEHALHFEINKLEKVIESQYITRSEKNRAKELIEDSNELIERTIRENDLMNLTLWLYNFLLKIGYCSHEEEKEHIQKKVQDILDGIDITRLAFNEKLWWFKVKVWENLVIRSSKVEDASKDWVEHFYSNQEMIFMHPVWYIKGNHYLLQALFNNSNRKDFDDYFKKFNDTIGQESFPNNPNVKNLVFIYKNSAMLNRDFLHVNFYNKHEWIFIFNETKKYEQVIDSHYLNIIKFKLGALFFIARSFDQSQTVLETIDNSHTSSQKDDLYFYTQILLLMNYYDGGDDENVETVLTTLHKMVNKRKFYGSFHVCLVQMFEDIFKSSPLETKSIFENNMRQLNQLKHDPELRKSHRYLNFKIWFKSHIQHQPVQELMRKYILEKIG